MKRMLRNPRGRLLSPAIFSRAAHRLRMEAGAKALLWVPAAVPRTVTCSSVETEHGAAHRGWACVHTCACSRRWGSHYILILDADNTMRDVLTLR